MDQRAFETLDIGRLLDIAARHVQTAPGRRRLTALQPCTDEARILHDLDLTTEAAEHLKSGERFSLSGLEDPAPALEFLQIEANVLEPKQVLGLEHLLAVAADTRAGFRSPESVERFPRLASLTAEIPDLSRVLRSIRGRILPGGELDDNASPELRMIRRELHDARNRIHRSLEAVLQSQPKAIQEELVTFRNGRFVIPVRTDSRGQIPGVVHGLSSSGQTTFVEPLHVIEQNNDIVRLREQEDAEVLRILTEITDLLRANRQAIGLTASILEELDVVQAKGRLSLEFGCVRPLLTADGRFALTEARHLLLEHNLRNTGAAVVPISFELDRRSTVLVVSGPNAGGKTVIVKTAGLIAAMAQMGMHVPAAEAVLPVFGQVFADIGDQQSISANLSTFTAHMRNISEMITQVRPPALVLLDEVGTGTDPDEGTALAIAIVDYFRRSGAIAIATTHYSGLKMWASQADGVRNASVEFDERTLRPTYRLISGVAGASSGLEIARRMNIPAPILDHARSLVNPDRAQAAEYLKKLKASMDYQEQLRAALEEERQATAAEYARLEVEFSRRELERRREFDRQIEQVIEDFTAESQKLLRTVKDRVEAERLKKNVASRVSELKRIGRQLRGSAGRRPAQGESGAAELQPSVPAEIGEGDRVRIESLGKEGIVESVRDDTVTVMVGPLRFRAARAELRPASAGGSAPAASSPRASGMGPGIDEETPRELNVIGTTADEALERVDKFLDQAFLAGAEEVRIIHGHGKGILRRAIAGMLSTHAQVESFRLAPPNQGGGGATIVTMRK